MIGEGKLIALVSESQYFMGAFDFGLTLEKIMKILATFVLLTCLSIQVYASGTDADLAAIKAQEKALKESDAKQKSKNEDLKRQEAAYKKKQDSQTANAVRPQLGKAAEGKSDEEVIRMYEQKVKQDDQKKRPNEAAIRAKGDAQTRNVTGKSMQDMQNMSDAELDSMEKKLLKQYSR